METVLGLDDNIIVKTKVLEGELDKREEIGRNIYIVNKRQKEHNYSRNELEYTRER